MVAAAHPHQTWGPVMRISKTCVATVLFAAGLIGPVQAQKAPTPSVPAAPITTGSVPSAAVASVAGGCTNPNALGVARVVEIDTTGRPGLGLEHFKAQDFLR